MIMTREPISRAARACSKSAVAAGARRQQDECVGLFVRHEIMFMRPFFELREMDWSGQGFEPFGHPK